MTNCGSLLKLDIHKNVTKIFLIVVVMVMCLTLSSSFKVDSFPLISQLVADFIKQNKQITNKMVGARSILWTSYFYILNPT